MFEMLSKYKKQGGFEFTLGDRLSKVCDAPTDRSGVYIIFACMESEKQLIYIGCSGLEKNGVITIRKGGMKDRLVNGKQFGKPRRNAWPEKMADLSIDKLLVYWWDTENDYPEIVEYMLLSEFKKEYNRLPLWNNEFRLKKELQEIMGIY